MLRFTGFVPSRYLVDGADFWSCLQVLVRQSGAAPSQTLANSPLPPAHLGGASLRLAERIENGAKKAALLRSNGRPTSQRPVLLSSAAHDNSAKASQTVLTSLTSSGQHW